VDTINCIKTRRSKRLFLNKKISEEKINQILECAINAPSSMNCQPWHFVIVKEEYKKERLARLKSEENRQHILTAPITIVVCIDTEKSPSRYVEDGVMAAQNILIAAHDLELGSVYVTGYNPSDSSVANELREILSIPEKILPIAILPIGDIDPSEKIDKKELINLADIIHNDGW
jgi:nitroreductase